MAQNPDNGDAVYTGTINVIKQIKINNNNSYGLRASALAYGQVVEASGLVNVIEATTNLPTGIILQNGITVFLTANNVASVFLSNITWALNVDGTGDIPVYLDTDTNIRAGKIFSNHQSFLFTYDTSSGTPKWIIHSYGLNPNITPLMDTATAIIGNSQYNARADHRHPVDTSRAPVNSPTFTGIPMAPTPSITTNNQQIATTEWVKNVIGDISGAMHFKGAAQQTITDGGTENAASSVVGSIYLGDAGDIYLQYNNSAEEYIWTGTVWEKFGIDTLPIASTSTPGIVQLGTNSSQAALGNHIHGNITNSGSITTTVTIAQNDGIIVNDNSDNNKIKIGPIFGGATGTYLKNDGTWDTPTAIAYLDENGILHVTNVVEVPRAEGVLF